MPFADLHCDTIHRLRYGSLKGDLCRNDGHVDLQRLIGAGYTLQVLAAFVELQAARDPLASCLQLLDDLEAQTRTYGELVSVVRTGADLQKEGLKALLSVEEGGVIGGDEACLDLLIQRGVRAVTLTWNYPNSLGFPNHEFTHADQGLTPFGRRMTEKLAAEGVAADVSHLSDQGFWEVADIVKGPFMASHSNARSVHPHPRNLTDEQIRRVAEQGGVIGLNFCSWFVDGGGHTSLAGLLRHFDHIHQVGGSEVLALGSDFDGIDNTVEIGGCEGMPMLEAALLEQGYGRDTVDKALYRNALRFFKDVLKD